MKRITFTTAGSYLAMEDHRAIKRWCKRHGVAFIKDGKCNYIIENQFFAKLQEIHACEEQKLSEIGNPEIVVNQYKPSPSEKKFEKYFSFL